MCFGGGKTTSTTQNQDPNVKAASKLALERARGINESVYKPYTGQRFAGFTPDQNNAFGMVRNLSSQPSALNQRLVDEGGSLGKISDYINPYIQNTLNPAIRDIDEAGARQRIGIGNNAQSAGAFGDARHGIVEGAQMRGQMQDIGDLSARTYSDAYNTAMSQRGADRTSMGAGQQEQMQKALALLGVGDRQQALTQQGLTAKQQDYEAGQEYKFRQLDSLLSFLTGNPTARQSTTQQTNANPLSSLLSLLGAGAGAVL